MIGAALAGYAMSAAQQFTGMPWKAHLLPKFPPYDRLIATKFFGFSSLLHPAGTEALRLCCLEAFFSFVFCFTTFTLVYSYRDSAVPGISELKRFIGGTLIFVSQLSIGERATLHLGYTAAAAGYYGDHRILLFYGLGNCVGLVVALIVFQYISKQGPVYKMLYYFNLLFASKQKVVDVKSQKSPNEGVTRSAKEDVRRRKKAVAEK